MKFYFMASWRGSILPPRYEVVCEGGSAVGFVQKLPSRRRWLASRAGSRKL